MDNKKILITGGSGFVGTNLVEYYLKSGWDVYNLDIAAPRNKKHSSHWHQVDLLNRQAVFNTLKDFSPTIVLHFGARTDLDERVNLGGYAANIEGTWNLIDAIREIGTIQRVIFASSQLVCRLGYKPASDDDYAPSTLYGLSKIWMERIIRTARLEQTWTIVRPTSFWGPWFGIPYRNFFDVIKKGLFIFPTGLTVWKQWGYVENSVFQIDGLLKAHPKQIHGRTFYMADYQPLSLLDFANAVSETFGRQQIRTVPLGLLRFVSKIGDGLQKMGWTAPPLTTFRLNNIITDEVQDLSSLEGVIGALPHDYREGIQRTVAWMQENIS
jgi:nucleoside-diphosphate-sugar epimerase